MDQTITQVEERLQREQERLGSEALGRYPVDWYIAQFAVPVYGSYGWVPPVAAAVCESIERELGLGALERYHRVALLTLISQYMQQENPTHPPVIRDCFTAQMGAIMAQMDRNPAGFYLHGNDHFAKDFAVCRQKLVPCGAQLVDVRGGIARRIVALQGVTGAIGFLCYMLGRVGGFKVVFEMHMDPRLVLEFNPKGWERCYLRIAKLLERHPDVLGVFGASWWFDPALHKVSPRLDFLRVMPTAGGARLFKGIESDAAVGNALANSRERKAAYEQGTYKPTNWLMVWSRKDLMAWAYGRQC